MINVQKADARQIVRLLDLGHTIAEAVLIAADAQKLYLDGCGLLDIANEFGCCIHTVKRALLRAGVEIRPRGRPHGIHTLRHPEVPTEALKRLRDAGMTLREIAAKVNLSPEAVRLRLKSDRAPSNGNSESAVSSDHPPDNGGATK